MLDRAVRSKASPVPADSFRRLPWHDSGFIAWGLAARLKRLRKNTLVICEGWVTRRNARKSGRARGSVQLHTAGEASAAGSSLAAGARDDGSGVAGAVGLVRFVICADRETVDSAGATAAGADFAGAVPHPQRAAVDGSDRRQLALSLVCGSEAGRSGVGCDGVHQEPRPAAAGRSLAEVFRAGAGAGRGCRVAG